MLKKVAIYLSHKNVRKLDGKRRTAIHTLWNAIQANIVAERGSTSVLK